MHKHILASCCSAILSFQSKSHSLLSCACRKKFLIEILEGSKVVSRKKGFTTTTCVSGVAIGQQTKQFDNLPASAKVLTTFLTVHNLSRRFAHNQFAESMVNPPHVLCSCTCV